MQLRFFYETCRSSSGFLADLKVSIFAFHYEFVLEYRVKIAGIVC